MQTPNSSLQADRVTVVYGRRRGAHARAVREATLEVAPGEVLGLVGESGSGKTTLGRALAGFIGVSAGEIRIGSEVLNSTDRRHRRSWGSRAVQMIFQDPLSALDPRQPVWKAVAEAGRGSSLLRGADEMLDLVGIHGRAQQRRPRELSGGQRQRVTIARAIAAAPSFLVCDEITSGLDASVRGEVLNLLLDAQADLHFGMVFISHDILVVSSMADRLAVMHDGELVEQGAAAAVIESPTHPYTRSLMQAVPRIHSGTAS